MISFNYPAAAASAMDTKFSGGILYLFEGALPTEAETRVTSAENGHELYNDCVAFLEVDAIVPSDRPGSVTFAQHSSAEYKEIATKGWHQAPNGEYHVIPDRIDLSEGNFTMSAILHQFGLASIRDTYLAQSPGASSPGYKQVIHEFDSPVTINMLRKSTTGTNSTYFYYHDGSDWVQVDQLGSSENYYTFADITATKFKIHAAGGSAAQHWLILGHTTTPGVNTKSFTPTYGILVPGNNTTQNWQQYTGSAVPTFTFQSGSIGDDLPLILNKSTFNNGDLVELVSLDITFQEIGDDTI